MRSSWRVRMGAVGAGILSLLVPFAAQAHEVYVLNNSQIVKDLAQPPVDLFRVAIENGGMFALWAFIGILVVICVLGISLSRTLEKHLDPFLLRIKPYAAHIAQITFGFALFASAYSGALFGTEIPLSGLFAAHVAATTFLLYVAAFAVLTGASPRLGGLIGVTIYISSVALGGGTYMLSYLTYFGEGLILLMFGGGYSIAAQYSIAKHSRFFKELERRKSFILRVCFATALIYAALYAKLIHGALALDTVTTYHLTNYFHFSSLFVVLGAFMIEMLIGIFFLLGFELRFTALFFLTFLTMSLLFFGETVWPHIILIGSAITTFVHGYDEFTIERAWYRKGRREPVL